MSSTETGSASTAGTAHVVVASNRGPVSYVLGDDGELTQSRGGGGLVAALSGASDAVWVCAALTEGDRRAARAAGTGHLPPADAGPDPASEATAVRMLVIDPPTFARAYASIANSTLWFVHHLLFNTAVEPSFGAKFARDWGSYVEYNETFAAAIASEAAPGARVVVQDYHLSLAPRMLRERRPDLRIGHFSHTPWAPPDYFQVLPDDIAATLLEGVLGADRAGFLTRRWAEAFGRCCVRVLGAKVEGLGGAGPLTVHHDGAVTSLDVHALGVDGPALRARADQPDVRARLLSLSEQVGDRQALVRIDRTELSKNIVRGLESYRELLLRYPQWRDRVVHVAFAYPSRHDLPVYREYTAAVQRLAQQINDEFGTAQWQPLLLDVQDDYARSLAAYRLADVLLVNPIRDGMNLVAKEGPVVAADGCALVLSREAGAAEELGEDALLVNPFDVVATAEALHVALSMDRAERLARSERLAAQATALPPAQWLAGQLAALAG
jgi:trehalose 6-phosphate synthase